MCGVGNLTRAAYANQRMTLDRNFAKESSKRNTMIALRGQSTWRVFIIHVLSKAITSASSKTWVSWTRHFFFCAGEVAMKGVEGE